MNLRNTTSWILTWLTLALAMTGCIPASAAEPTPATGIDARFIEFYNLMGGERTLGQALGPAFTQGGKIFQYTENVLMVYDETRPIGDRFNFEPLGATFGIQDAPLPAPADQPDVRSLNGHILFSDFAPFFDTLGGVRFVGYPLTEVRWNPEKSRYEQYFEKMGFYRRENETEVRLLPYGKIACQRAPSAPGCSASISEAIIENAHLPQPFLPIVERLGHDFTGAPLSEPYLAADGMLEQIYENIVLAVHPGNLRTIGLRALPLLIGHQRAAFVPPLNDPLMTFMVLDPATGLGHNIPRPFLTYIAAHGGQELAGPPIGELFETEGVRRQCFEKYCLDFDPTAPPQAQIRPAALGRVYLRQHNYQPAAFSLLAWEAQSVITPGQEQVLGARVFNETVNQPMKDAEPTLEITLPDGVIKKWVFPPTSASGNTYLKINLPGLKSGDLVVYKICISQPGSTPLCVSDSWLVR
ncbi:MAG: hypothetical protein NZP74_13415 [Anaerolineales bacterium]|nr:hypothetical protein [Anaerolineales bacterium]MDW8279344.1 hypothetical protein [Anaerolineales bacterium]